MTSKIPSLLRDPFTSDSFRRQLDRLMSDFWPGGVVSESGDQWLQPAIDMVESESELKLTAELPGLDESDIELEYHDRQLLLKGEKRVEVPATAETEKDAEDKQPGYHVMERRYGAFMRAIPIPFEVDPAQIRASCHKGVLTVIIPKPVEAKQPTHRIDVQFKPDEPTA